MSQPIKRKCKGTNKWGEPCKRFCNIDCVNDLCKYHGEVIVSVYREPQPKWGDEPLNNLNPKNGLYRFKQIGNNRNWVRRCQATSRWTTVQCQRACKKESKGGFCGKHGGNNLKGNTTNHEPGRIAKIGAELLRVHGRETAVIRKERAINLLIVRYHEDALRVLDGLDYKQRVTELKGFQPFRDIDEVTVYLTNLGFVEAHSDAIT
jgi:hypothetical protein